MERGVVAIGSDLATNIFQINAVGSNDEVLVRRKLRRAEVIRFFTDWPACLVGIEACALLGLRAYGFGV